MSASHVLTLPFVALPLANCLTDIDALGRASKRIRQPPPDDSARLVRVSPLESFSLWRGRLAMPKLSVEGYGTFEVEEGKRLVLAIEQDAKVDILHACGGNARCTTCRVVFIDGEPDTMTVDEKNVLSARGVAGVRLSCQILCDHDMRVRAVSRLEGSGRADAGGAPAAQIAPPPEWTNR